MSKKYKVYGGSEVVVDHTSLHYNEVVELEDNSNLVFVSDSNVYYANSERTLATGYDQEYGDYVILQMMEVK